MFRRILPAVRGLHCTRQSAIVQSSRGIIHHVDSAAFESEILQSQGAICLIFHISSNAACQQQLSFCDGLTDTLNSEAGSSWLKLCAIDGDRNRNLASAMSVQRAKLPTAFFLLNATIIDRVSGNIPQARMEAILRKFMEHFHTTQGKDVAHSTPLAAAATADLTSGAPTAFLQTKIYNSLVGVEMIRLPQEAPQMEGIKKLIQQTKEQAFRELQDLHKSIGMDVRRLTNEELQEQYFSTEAYRSAAALGALEALFLARVYGSVGQIDPQLASNALASVRREFNMASSDPVVKLVSQLVELNMVRGKCREELPKIQSKLATSTTLDERETLQDDLQFLEQTMRWIELLDGRRELAEPDASGTSPDFPTGPMEDMFAAFRTNVVKGKKSEKAAARAGDMRVLLMTLMQLFPKDPQSIGARARLSSMLF